MRTSLNKRILGLLALHSITKQINYADKTCTGCIGSRFFVLRIKEAIKKIPQILYSANISKFWKLLESFLHFSDNTINLLLHN